MHRIPRTVLIIAGLWLFLYSSFALLTPPLLDDADSVHAEVAREMIQRHDPVTLYANGIRYLEKAPLLYWSMAANMSIFGVSTAAARFPLAVYVLLLFLLTAAFAKRCFNSERTGLYAGVGTLLSFGIFIFTRILIPDAIVCLWLTAALYCFWLTETSRQERNDDAPVWPCLGFAAACALNVLTKGLIGLVFPIGTILLYLLITRGLRRTGQRLLQFHPIVSSVVFFAIAAPWHIAAGRANPTEGHPPGLTHPGHILPWFWKGWQVGSPTLGNVHGWTWFYFMNEHLLRYLNLRVPRDYDTVPLVLFWGLILIWMMPWSAFLWKAMSAVPWRKATQQLRHRTTAPHLDPEEKALTLLAIAALLPLIFFSFSTRQEYYVLPSLPFLTMLVARWLDREATEAESLVTPSPLCKSGERISIALFYAGGLFGLVCGFFLLHTQAPNPGTDLAALLKQNPGEYALSFGHFLDLNAAAMGMFRDPLTLAGTALLLGTAAAWWLRRDDQPHQSNIALAVATLLFLGAAHKALGIFSPVLSSQPLAAQIQPMLKHGNIVVINGEYESGSTLAFYLRNDNIRILNGRSSNLWYGSFFTDAPPIFYTNEDLRKRWNLVQRIFVWTTPDTMPAVPGKVYVIAETGGKQIVSNKQGDY
jgi:4-amino-4-deoxy-L-arabinose transferase-like glycosyltransferase